VKRENGVGGNVKMTLAMLVAPAFARSEKIGFVADAARRIVDITGIVRIAPAMDF
jgi:hypothetical protein